MGEWWIVISVVFYWCLFSFYFFYFSLFGVMVLFFVLYFYYLGFFSLCIGELVVIFMLMCCVVFNLWGWLGDCSGQCLVIVCFGVVCMVLGFLLIFVSYSYVWLVLVMVLYVFFWYVVLLQFEVIILVYLCECSVSYSWICLWGLIGFICIVVGFGVLFECLSLDVYLVMLLGIMFGIVLCSWWVFNVQLVYCELCEGEGGFFVQLCQLGVLVFYLCVCLMQLFYGLYYIFLILYLELLGYSWVLIGLFWVLGVVVEVMLFFVMLCLL